MFLLLLFSVNTRLCFLKVHFEGGQGWVRSTKVSDMIKSSLWVKIQLLADDISEPELSDEPNVL